MPTALVVYPAYGTISCAEAGRYAAEIPDLKFVLADDEPTSSDEAVYTEIVELPPPEEVGAAYDIMRRWCERRRPDAIMMQSERGLLLGSLLVRDYGLKGPSVKAAHLCANKYAQRLALSRAGICVPAFALAETAREVRRHAGDFGYPVVLKCVISTMSRLVTLVCGPEDVELAVDRMRARLEESKDVARLAGFSAAAKIDLGCDPRRQFLVERFMSGELVETDGLVVRDRPFTFGVIEQIQSTDPPFFITGYLFPAECSENKPIEAVSDAMIGAIGLTDSGFSNEMRIHEGQTCVIEINGRLGWDEGFGNLFEVRTHRERIFQTVQLALGIKPDLIRDESRFAAIAYRCCFYDGIVERLPSPEELAKLETEHLKLGLATHEGARFLAPPDPYVFPHVAWALATHPGSSHTAYEIAREVVEGLDIEIKSV